MLRTHISLTVEERRALDAASARTGRSISALIRDAVDAMYGSQRSTEDDLTTMRRARGAWADRDVDGEGWVDRMRSGRRLEGLGMTAPVDTSVLVDYLRVHDLGASD